MAKRSKPQPIPNNGSGKSASSTQGILELERFTDTDLDRWNQLSKHLDELHHWLYFGFEAQRSMVRNEIVSALQAAGSCTVSFERWCRIVEHRFSLDPLSPAGSLFGVGGRFNVGRDIPQDIRAPWPALYIASTTETAYREKYGIARETRLGGLTREELALLPKTSHSVVMVSGVITNAFDLTSLTALAPLCRVLAKFRMPPKVGRAMKARRINQRKVQIVRTPAQLQKAVMASNWRLWPTQFEIPAHGQVLAGLVVAAGF